MNVPKGYIVTRIPDELTGAPPHYMPNEAAAYIAGWNWCRGAVMAAEAIYPLAAAPSPTPGVTCPYSERCDCIGKCKHGFAGSGATPPVEASNETLGDKLRDVKRMLAVEASGREADVEFFGPCTCAEIDPEGPECPACSDWRRFRDLRPAAAPVTDARDVYPVPETEAEQAASGLEAGPEMSGNVKPYREGRYLRYFDDVDAWAWSELIDGTWRRDGFFDSDVQDAPWKGGVRKALATPSDEPGSGEALKAEWFDYIASEYLTVEPFDMPTGQGDADVGWRVHQYQGRERKLLVEHYFDNLADALAAANGERGK